VSSSCAATSNTVRGHAPDAPDEPPIGTPAELALLAAACRLGAPRVAGWSAAEQRLARRAAAVTGAPATRAGLADPSGPADLLDLPGLAGQIRAGDDPLGVAFCALRGAARRRPRGQTFTPPPVIEAMAGWAAGAGRPPARVVDPGCGSARFLLAAARRWPEAELVGVEIDPAAAILGRASLAAAGLAARSRIIVGDYTTVRLPPAPGPVLFLGNPPYVRHHLLPAAAKDWLRRAAAEHGLPASGLAGLHVHFFLATARHAAPRDTGVLITAAEWLDVNYGALVRALLAGPLGGRSLHLIEPTERVFADADATAVIACFRPGVPRRAIRLRRVPSVAALGRLSGGCPVPVAVLRTAARWGPLLRGTGGGLPEGHVELGELCRVHRGQVTGANAVWIAPGPHPLIPARFQFRTVTGARELFAAGRALLPGAALRLVIDLPASLDELADAEREPVARFLGSAAAAGADRGYVARHRTPWWRVRLPPPASLLASYMARRPPAFVRNVAGARHLNIAHGLYPREPLAGPLLDALARVLAASVTTGQGRVYAGGLVKFEPREMERLPVPGPALLAALARSGPARLAGLAGQARSGPAGVPEPAGAAVPGSDPAVVPHMR
jgi:adenine-specific DNA-methyltransferase